MRNIILIDEAKCDGCGLCVTACAEGALEVVDGKAKLVSETYCDGLGACLGECPRGAISIETRGAGAFDEAAAQRHLAGRRGKTPPPACPGSDPRALPVTAGDVGEAQPSSRLANWPVQLALAPLKAACFQGVTLLLAADCVPFALAGFHQRLLAGRTLLVGCPKLDDLPRHVEKLTAIIRENDVRGIEVAYMEVPCCSALARGAAAALESSGKRIPLTLRKISLRGDYV